MANKFDPTGFTNPIPSTNQATAFAVASVQSVPNILINNSAQDQARRYAVNNNLRYVPTVYINDDSLIDNDKFQSGMLVRKGTTTLFDGTQINKSVPLNGTALLWDTQDDKYVSLDEVETSSDYKMNMQSFARNFATAYTNEQAAEKERKEKMQKYFSDTTDPTQVNSIGDVAGILLSHQLHADYFKDLKNGVYTSPTEAVGGLLKDTVGGFVEAGKGVGSVLEQQLSPIFNPVEDEYGKSHPFVQALNNTLTNVGETMDYFTGANLVKGMFYNKGDLGKTFTSGMLFNKDTGRQQYDVHTGSVITDTVLEVAADPTTYLTIGLSGVLKSIGKTSGGVIETGVRKIASEAGVAFNDTAISKITAQATKEFMKSSKTMPEIFQDITRGITQTGAFDQSIKGTVVERMVKNNVRPDDVVGVVNVVKAEKLNKMLDIAKDAGNTALDSTTYNLMKNMRGVIQTTNTFEDFIAKGAWNPTVVGGSWQAFKFVKDNRHTLGMFGDAVMSNMMKLLSKPVDTSNVKDVAEQGADILRKTGELSGIDTTEPIKAFVKACTEDAQYATMNKLTSICTDSNKPAVDKIRELNQYAKEKGFNTIGDYLDRMYNDAEAILPKYRNDYNIITKQVHTIYNEQLINSIDNVVKTIDNKQYNNLPDVAEATRNMMNNPMFLANSELSDSVVRTYKALVLNKYNLRDTDMFKLKTDLAYLKNTLFSNIYDGIGKTSPHMEDDFSKVTGATFSSAIKTKLDNLLKPDFKDKHVYIDKFIMPDAKPSKYILETDFMLNNSYNPSSVFLRDVVQTVETQHKQFKTPVLDNLNNQFARHDNTYKILKQLEAENDSYKEAGFSDLYKNLFVKFVHDTPLTNDDYITAKRLYSVLGLKDGNPVTVVDATSKKVLEQHGIQDLLYRMVREYDTELKSYYKQAFDGNKTIRKFKLSNAYVTKLITDTPQVRNLLELIRTRSNMYSTVAKDLTWDNGTYKDTLLKLVKLARTLYVYDTTVRELNNKAMIPKRIKGAVIDAISGKTYNIGNVDYFVENLLRDVRTQLNGYDSSMNYKFNLNLNTPDTAGNVERLFKATTDEKSELGLNQFNDVVGEAGKRNVYYSVAMADSVSIKEISFRDVDGNITTFVNQAKANVVPDDNTLSKQYNMHSAQEYVNFKAEQFERNRILASELEFPTLVSDYIRNLQNTIKTEHKASLRLIGHNTSDERLGHKEALRKTFNLNNIYTQLRPDGINAIDGYSTYVLDMAQLYAHTYSNEVIIEDTCVQALKNVFKDTKLYQDIQAEEKFGLSTNIVDDLVEDAMGETTKLQVGITPNFGKDFIDAVRSIKESIGGKGDTSAVGTDSLNYLYSVAAEAEKGLLNTYRTIAEHNSDLQKIILNDANLYKYTGDPNISHVLKQILDGDGASPIATQRVYVPEMFAKWTTGYELTAHNLPRLAKVQKILNTIDGIHNSISRELNILVTRTAGYSKCVQEILVAFQNNFKDREIYLGTVMNILRASKTEAQQLAVYVYMFELIKHSSNMKYLDGIAKQDEAFQLTLNAFKQSGKYITNKQGLFNPFHDRFSSFHFREYAPVNQLYTQGKVLEDALEKCDSYNEMLRVKEILDDVMNTNAPQTKVIKHCVDLYTEFVNSYKGRVEEIQKDFHNGIVTHRTDGEVVRRKAKNDLELTMNFNKRMEDYLKSVEYIGKRSIEMRELLIKNMPPEDFSKYIYKYAHGKILVDLSSERLTASNNTDFIEALHKLIRVSEQYGVKHVLNKRTNEMYLYLEQADTTDEFIEQAKAFTLDPSGLYVGDKLSEFFKFMDKATDNAYSTSHHNVFSKEQHANELDRYLCSPEVGAAELVKRAPSPEHYALHRMDSLSFNHSIIGDYTSGIGTVFARRSKDPLTNIASGFSATYNSMATKDNLYSLLFSNENNLENVMQQALRVDSSLDRRGFVKALKENNYVFCTLNSNRQLRLVDDNVLSKPHIGGEAYVLPEMVYNHCVERLNDNAIHSDFLNALNKNYLSLIKFGMVSTAGMAIRNVPDSTIKAFLQTGDLDYWTTWRKTNRTKQAFERTLTDLYSKCKGGLTDENIVKYFMELEEDADMSVSLFMDIYKFLNSSSASPLLRQEQLDSNVFAKLKRFSAHEEAITEDMLRKLLGHVEKFPDATNEEVMQLCKKLIPNDTATMLKLYKLRFLIPSIVFERGVFVKFLTENKFSPVKYITNFTQSFEQTVRLHTYLYWKDYRLSSTGKAYNKVDTSQFNRSRDTRSRRLMEMVMPFSSFQTDNLMYWIETIGSTQNKAIFYKWLCGQWNPQEDSPEEIMNNQSLQYMLGQGNLPISSIFPSDNIGLSLKLGNSAYSAMNFMTQPVNTLKEMLHTDIESAITVIKLLEQCQDNNKSFAEYFKYLHDLDTQKFRAHNGEDVGYLTEEEQDFMYNAVRKDDLLFALTNMIPFLGVWTMRIISPIKKTNLADDILPFLSPVYDKENLYADGAGWSDNATANTISIALATLFSVVKMSEAGTYKGKYLPVGFDWYNQDEAYHNTHKYVMGLSYVPAFISKNPTYYVDTYARLLKLGYDKAEVSEMMQNGWHIRDKSFILVNYNTQDKYPYWIMQDTGAYKRTQQGLLEQGYTIEQANELIVDGWFIATNGELVDHGEQNRVDAVAFEQLKDFQAGLAPFPMKYVSKANRTEDGGGDDWETAFMKKHNRKPSEMWFNPETQSIYFKNNVPRSRSYKTYNRRATNTKRAKKFVIKKVYVDKVYSNGGLIKATAPTAYRNVAWAEQHKIVKDLYMGMGYHPTNLFAESKLKYFRQQRAHNRLKRVRKQSAFKIKKG